MFTFVYSTGCVDIFHFNKTYINKTCNLTRGVQTFAYDCIHYVGVQLQTIDHLLLSCLLSHHWSVLFVFYYLVDHLNSNGLLTAELLVLLHTLGSLLGGLSVKNIQQRADLWSEPAQ